MAKFRAYEKKEQVVIKSKLLKGEEINIRALKLFSNAQITGFFNPQEDGGNITYTADIPQCMKLIALLKSGVGEGIFYLAVAQIIEMLKNLDRNKLFAPNLLLDEKYVYVNPSTLELFAVYQPIVSRNSVLPICGFFIKLMECVKIKPEENRAHINAFSDFLHKMGEFSPDSIERYIRNSYPEVYERMATFQPVQAAPYVSVENMGFAGDGTVLLGGTDTVLLDENMAYSTDTVLLSEPLAPVYPTLLRRSTGEEIVLGKEENKLGKESVFSDYVIGGNKTISRYHAQIVARNGRYLIKDNNSKNKTFVNGTVAPPYQEIEIKSGDIIRLADEEFEFKIN